MLATGIPHNVPLDQGQSAVVAGARPAATAPWPREVEVDRSVLAAARLDSVDGQSEFITELAADDLGRLGVKVLLHEGAVRVALAAEKPELASLLRGELPQLQQALEQQGIKLAGLAVQSGLVPQRGFADGRRQRQEPPSSGESETSNAEGVSAVESNRRRARIGHSSVLDVLVRYSAPSDGGGLIKAGIGDC